MSRHVASGARVFVLKPCALKTASVSLTCYHMEHTLHPTSDVFVLLIDAQVDVAKRARSFDAQADEIARSQDQLKSGQPLPTLLERLTIFH